MITNLILHRHFIMSILHEYPDPKKTPESAEKFKAFLRERVSLDQALSELSLRIYSHLKKNPHNLI